MNSNVSPSSVVLRALRPLPVATTTVSSRQNSLNLVGWRRKARIFGAVFSQTPCSISRSAHLSSLPLNALGSSESSCTSVARDLSEVDDRVVGRADAGVVEAHVLIHVRRLHVLAHVRARVRQAAVVVRVGERPGERVAVRGEVGGHTVAHPRQQIGHRNLPQRGASVGHGEGHVGCNGFGGFGGWRGVGGAHLHVTDDSVDELRRDLIRRHRSTEEAHAHDAHAEDEAGLAGAEDDAEGLAVVRRAVVVAADELVVELALEFGLLLELERRDVRGREVVRLRQRNSHAPLQVGAELVDLGDWDPRLESLLQALGAVDLSLLGHLRKPQNLRVLPVLRLDDACVSFERRPQRHRVPVPALGILETHSRAARCRCGARGPGVPRC
eukprot:7376370-Prymnesium_polylepis.2